MAAIMNSVPVLNRILMVEDETDIRTLAQLSLEAVGGYTVALCSSGKEAIRVAPGFKPDLILLDVIMPEMDGPDTLRALRQIEEVAAIPIIFLTGKSKPAEITSFKDLGAAGVIAKPFDPLSLPLRVRELWEELYG